MGALGLANFVAGFEQHRCSDSGWWRSCVLPDLSSVKNECLLAAEESAYKVLSFVQPTSFSENRRREIADYLQKLIRSNCSCEAIRYGSVPLKTYLPDGDIDFTVFNELVPDESIAGDVYALILGEQENEDGEYKIMDAQFINAAEVKLVKCIVEDVVIDVSFNQLGGLSTLCFLELVDRIVGRNHLFKRSIILIKAWCHYESRILGSNRGLLSTYALEILILYIIHQFNSSLNGPVAVLYQFLSYYSQFDWENYCISLRGPVCKSSLPDIIVKSADSICSAPLLSEKFLDNCIQMFSVSSRMSERRFQTKHLNIIDPLNASNNLGRSVQQGSFYRIQSAFKYGAFKLSQALSSQPSGKVGDELSEFFRSTLTWHRKDHRSRAHHDSLTESLSEGNFLSKLSVSECVNLDHSDTTSCDHWESELTTSGVLEATNRLADLTGDYDSHIWSLLNGQCHSFLLSSSAFHPAPSPFMPYPNQNYGFHQRMPHSSIQLLESSPFSVSMQPNMDLSSISALPVSSGNSNEARRTRGTGTYIPLVNFFYRENIPRGSFINKAASYCWSRLYRHGFGYTWHPANGILHDTPAIKRFQSPPHPNGWFLIGSHRVEIESGSSLAQDHFSSSSINNSYRCLSPKAQQKEAVYNQERSSRGIEMLNFPPLCFVKSCVKR